MTPNSLTDSPSQGQELILLLGIAGCLLLANLLTWMAFRLDARRAEEGVARVPAATLLLLALLGGSPAALLSQLAGRRGSRRGLGLSLTAIVAAQVLAAGAAFLPFDRIADWITALKVSTLATVGAESKAAPDEKVMPHRFGPGSEKPATTGFGG